MAAIIRTIALTVTAVVALTPVLVIEYAGAQSVQRGQTYARINCSKCHSIAKVGPSPLSVAPPFRALHLRYPVEDLEESLREGIVTGHPTMPEFTLDPGETADFIAFLKTLQ